MQKNTKYSIIIGWLYPELMSIYGDRGNIIVLKKRCEWRGINVEVRRIDQSSSNQQLATCDLLMMGGAQDSQQIIVARDLEKKKRTLSGMIESKVPGLYICGGFQFLGHYYKEADGTTIEQLGVLNVYTENPGGERLIGNMAIEVDGLELMVDGKKTISHNLSTINPTFVGFENHGGRTRLGTTVKPLGKVLKGYGSNAEDGTEGAVYKNSIGTYVHGPILPKNPELADWLIAKAIEKKYPSTSSGQVNQIMKPLDDSISQIARNTVLQRLGVI